jgi:hypothetical protein
MDRKSIIIERKSIHTFLSGISFNKQYYNLYNDIISGKIDIDETVLIYLVCQTAFQVGFDGYFDEFYNDISRRRNIYAKQILSNFKTAYLSKETYISKMYKCITRSKMSNIEMFFNRIIQSFNFEFFMAEMFIEDNEDLKFIFITICNLILSQNRHTNNKRIVPINY